MIKKENFAKAYKEVYVIIEHLKEDEKSQIPQEFIEMLETKMDKEYVFNYDATKDLSEQQVLRETLKAIKAGIFDVQADIAIRISVPITFYKCRSTRIYPVSN